MIAVKDMADNNVTITRVTKFRINLYAHYLLAKPNRT